jgi:hypothetical protein
MAIHYRIVRGTFDATQVDQTLELVKGVERRLRDTIPQFDGLETLASEEGKFLWLARFVAQCPINADAAAIAAEYEAYRNQAQDAAITFDIEEFGVYRRTYPDPVSD